MLDDDREVRVADDEMDKGRPERGGAHEPSDAVPWLARRDHRTEPAHQDADHVDGQE